MSPRGQRRFSELLERTRHVVRRVEARAARLGQSAPFPLGNRLERVSVAGFPILQTAAAAAAAWWLAQVLLGHPRPFFAPIAALIAMGFSVGRRSSRALQMFLGVAFGILVADGVVYLVGRGAWQLGLACGVAMLAAAFLSRSELFITQAGVSAILALALGEALGTTTPRRLTDALVGGGVAVVVSLFLFPADPLRLVGSKAEPVLDDLEGLLEAARESLEEGDPVPAREAGQRTAATTRAALELHEALAVAEQAARLAPRRRLSRGDVARYSQAARHLEWAFRQGRVLTDGAARLSTKRADDALASSLADLRRAVQALRVYLREERDQGDVADHVADALEHLQGLEGSSALLADNVRSVAERLLRAAGLDEEETEELLRPARR